MPTEQSPEEIAKSHRWHAVECNNLAWSLSELRDRTDAQNSEMLHAAHASVFHWSKVGTELNAARGSMLLGNVHAALGNGALAVRYAEESFRYFTTHETPDWEIAFAHAILAHAAFAANDTATYRTHYAEAEKLGHALADQGDRDIFLKTFDLIPKP